MSKNGLDGSSESANVREVLTEIVQALRELHRQLVSSSRSLYELDHGIAVAPTELLRLLTTEPEFAWLRELSGLMVDLDQLLELANIEREDAEAARAEVERLLVGDRPGSDFGERYREALQSETDVVIAHGRVRASVRRLPAPTESLDAESQRRSWSRRRFEARKRPL